MRKMMQLSCDKTVYLVITTIYSISQISQADVSCIKTKDGGQRTMHESGNSNGANCVFPFTYNGETYNRCTSTTRSVYRYNAWCATTDNYPRDKKWGYCIITTHPGEDGTAQEGAECQFPFWYKGTFHRNCLTTDRNEPWCETDNNWGYCDLIGTACLEKDTTMRITTPTTTFSLSTTTTMATPATPTAMATPAIMITLTTLVAGIVIVVVVITGVIAVVVGVIVYRKKQRNAVERPTADTSAYYNVSPATRLHPHNTAPKISRRNPHAESTASYEQIALAGDYYNISQVKDGSNVGETIYELPQIDGIEIAESSNTGDVYQPLENAAAGGDLQTTAVDYENVDISSDYLTTLY